MGRKPTGKPTSFDIAYLAGVSQPTVSRALRGDKAISGATRARIQKIARDMNYAVDKNASSLRSQRANTIALLFFEDPTPDDSSINPFFHAMLGAIARECAHQRYDLIISFQALEDDWHAQYQDSHRADGLILLGYGDYSTYESRLEQLVRQGTYFVRWGSVADDNIGVTLGSDNFSGGKAAGEHLIERGRRRIAFIGSADEHCPEFAERYRGLCTALEQAGVACDPALRRDAISSEEQGYEEANWLLEHHPDIDAIFTASDLIAFGAMRALREAGRTAGEDISVVGFDDIPAASVAGLTSVMQDTVKAGRQLVRSLIAQIEDTPLPERILPSRLVVRASS